MSILETAIGFIAPPCCVVCGVEGSALCLRCQGEEIVPFGPRCFGCGAISPNGRTCEHCRRGAPRYVWVSTNYEGGVQELVKIYKFGHLRAAAEPLAEVMSKTLLGYVSQDALASLYYLIIPVPTATSRVRERGFDHSAILARQISRKLALRYSNPLARLGQSRQVGAIRTQRLAQLSGNYMVRRPEKITGENILLVDDVVTTGGTLRAATKVLRAAGAARVDALVFAKRL